jgi:RNA polymerase sigma factor (TIGR02999 family)
MENPEITQLLGEARRGNLEAQSQLALAVYRDLHRLAAHYMHSERPNHSLQATVLVNEAFMRLVSESERTWQNRSHFFAAAAQTMRRILIDYARSRRAGKRGWGHSAAALSECVVLDDDHCEEWLAVDQALRHLARRDERLAKIVEFRFFAGLTEEEVGEVLGISVRTVKREWKVAKAWLHADLSSAKADD